MGNEVSISLVGSEGDLAMHRINAYFGDLLAMENDVGIVEFKKFLALDDI